MFTLLLPLLWSPSTLWENIWLWSLLDVPTILTSKLLTLLALLCCHLELKNSCLLWLVNEFGIYRPENPPPPPQQRLKDRKAKDNCKVW